MGVIDDNTGCGGKDGYALSSYHNSTLLWKLVVNTGG